ncbi:hypothetical protein [Bradyrhizobium sp. ARR65]|uniref:hypothetical protein n=1 Tax=Bradyrhizobium sp. ARR65 TaxID=1040989 RepID=UPI00046547D5|nr:hypothetical protein [Bradyrhizobium sp. ARR65]
MSDLDAHQNESASSTHSGLMSLLWRQLPFVVALVLAIAGVAYTNISHQPLVGYWEFLALAIGVVCVVTKWPELHSRDARLRLIWTQAVHWVAVLIAMNIVLVSRVQQLLPTPATSLVLLTLLALGTFLAGVSLLSLRICFLGIAMAVTVPAISWLQQSVIFFVLAAVLLIGLGLAFWLRQGDDRASAPPN